MVRDCRFIKQQGLTLAKEFIQCMMDGDLTSSPARCRLHFPGFRESNMDRVAKRRSPFPATLELTMYAPARNDNCSTRSPARWDSCGPSSEASNRKSTPSERGR